MIIAKDPQGNEFTAFADADGRLCKLWQASQLSHLPGVPLLGLGRMGNGMLLTPEDVEALLPHLQSWLTTGSLSPGEEKQGGGQ